MCRAFQQDRPQKEMAQAHVARDSTSLIPFSILATALGKNAKESATFSTRGRWTRPKTRTSAITHDFFLVSPRGNPQDWQAVRKTWQGDKPGRVVCVTWGAGLTWCPRVGAGIIPVGTPVSRSGGWPPRRDRIRWLGRCWSGWRRISSVLGWNRTGLGGSAGTHTAGYFWGKICQEQFPSLSFFLVLFSLISFSRSTGQP